MAAEVVVVVEDQNACIAAGSPLVEVRSRQAADAAPDDDEVVSLRGIVGIVPGATVAERVRDFMQVVRAE